MMTLLAISLQLSLAEVYWCNGTAVQCLCHAHGVARPRAMTEFEQYVCK